MSCVVGMLTLNGSVSIPACVNFGVASVAGGLEESAKKWAKVATEDAALYKAAVEPVGDWNQWQSAYNDRYRKAVEIVMLTTTGRLLLELCCASRLLKKSAEAIDVQNGSCQNLIVLQEAAR